MENIIVMLKLFEKILLNFVEILEKFSESPEILKKIIENFDKNRIIEKILNNYRRTLGKKFLENCR